MVTFKTTQLPDPTLPEPEVRGLLDDITGGETNLVPEALTHNALKVWFTVPAFSDPSIAQERVELFVDDQPTPIAWRTWTAPIEDSDRYLELPQTWLRNNDGQHRLYYVTQIYNGQRDFSLGLVITLDTRAPMLAAVSKLTFPSVILPPNKLTARYLEQNGDQVKAGIPGYTTPRPGDRITWFWGTRTDDFNKGGVIDLDHQNHDLPLELIVNKQLIVDRGKGDRYVSYQVLDRAGNQSAYSIAEKLEVDVTPRTFAPSKVKEASGGASSGTLTPSKGVSGVTVTIPPEAIIYDDEDVYVQWAEPDTVGAFRTNTPVSQDSREYRIPKDKIAQHLGKTLPVYYEVFEPGVVKPHESGRYSLRIEDLTGLPTVQCNRVSGGSLSLASLTTGFADFTLGSWTFMATDQYLTVWVEGVDTNTQRLEIPVLTEYQVPAVASTIPVGRISKVDLQRFKLGTGIEVAVKVSFDNKQTWKSFPRLKPTLVA